MQNDGLVSQARLFFLLGAKRDRVVYHTNVGVYVSVCIFTGTVHAECNGYGDDQAKKCMEDYIYMVAVRELLNRDPHRRISKLKKSKVGPKAGDTIKKRKRRKGREKKKEYQNAAPDPNSIL